MITATLSYLVVLLLYWMFQTKLREVLWRELPEVPQKSLSLVLRTIKTQWITFSPKNILFQAQLDLELGLRSYREALLLICMNRLSVKLIGLLLLVSLSQWSVILLILVGGALLLLFSKNLKSVLQVVFLAASFLVVFQFSFYSFSRWIYGSDEMSIFYFLSDARWPVLLAMILVGFLITVIIKFEFAALILSALLFFSGSLPLTNAMGLIFGETLGWAALWIYWSQSRSRFGKRLFYETFVLSLIAGSLVFVFFLMARGFGFFNVRVMGDLESKKMIFLVSWAFLEIVITAFYMIWGHFRFQITGQDPSEVEPLYYSRKQFRYSGWIHQQTSSRLQKAQNKLENLQKSKTELTADELKMIPQPFLKKMIIEVETLKTLIEQLKART